jgi:hypothetical protein
MPPPGGGLFAALSRLVLGANCGLHDGLDTVVDKAGAVRVPAENT